MIHYSLPFITVNYTSWHNGFGWDPWAAATVKALQTETCLFPLGGRADWPAKAPKNRHVFVWRWCVFSLDHSLRNGLDRAEVGLPGFCLIMFKICVASFYLTLGILNKLVFKPKIENWWVKGSHTRALTSLQWSSSLLWTSSSKLQTHEILSCIFWIWPMHEFCEHSRQHWISVFACSRGKCTIIRGLFHFGQGPWSRSLLLSSDWSFEGLIFGSDQRIYRLIDDCESFVILLFGMRQGEGGILFSDVPVAEGWSALARTSAESSPVLIFLRAPTSGRPVCIRMYSMYLWVVCIALYLYLFAFWRHSCSGFDSVWIFLEHPPYVCRRNWQYFEKNDSLKNRKCHNVGCLFGRVALQVCLADCGAFGPPGSSRLAMRFLFANHFSIKRIQTHSEVFNQGIFCPNNLSFQGS